MVNKALPISAGVCTLYCISKLRNSPKPERSAWPFIPARAADDASPAAAGAKTGFFCSPAA
jgi:hypothetical protein